MNNIKNIIFLEIGFFISLIISIFISLIFNIKNYNINNLILLISSATIGLSISGKLLDKYCTNKDIEKCKK